MNLNVAFQTAMNLYAEFCKVNEFKFKKMNGSNSAVYSFSLISHYIVRDKY